MSKKFIKLEELSYEQAFAELEGIIAALETEGRTLDQAITLYERGQALAGWCTGLLDAAELKVQALGGVARLEMVEED